MGESNMIEKGPRGSMVPSAQAESIVSPITQSEQPITEVRSILSSKVLLSQTVDTQLLPPERFKGEQKGEIVDIHKIGEIVAVLRKIDGHYEATVYDTFGKLTNIDLDISSQMIAQRTTMGYVAIEPRANGSSNTEKISEIISRFGFADTQAQELEKIWFAQAEKKFGNILSGSYGDASKGDVVGQPPLFISNGSWRAEVKRNTQGTEMFVFNSGEDSHFKIDPKTPFTKVSVNNQNYKLLQDTVGNLVGDLKLQRENTIFNIFNKSGQIAATYSGTEPQVDPSSPSDLYFINTGQIYKLDLTGVSSRTAIPVAETQFKINNPQELNFEPNGNFLLVRTADNKLLIVDKVTGDMIKDFDGVKGPMIVDNQGDILFVDTQGKLRQIQTNFQAIPTGGSEEAQKNREEELKKMQERFANLELKKVRRESGVEVTEEVVARTLRETISRQVSEQMVSGNSSDIEDVLDRLQALKGDPANQSYGEVIDEFINQARDKLSGIRTGEFDSQLDSFQQTLDGIQSVGDTIGLDEQFASLLDTRQKIDVTDPQKRREIEQKMRTLQTKKDMISSQYQGELIGAARQTLPQLDQLIKETGSSQELSYVATSPESQQFEMMLANIRDPQVRKELRDKYGVMRAEQRTRLEAKSRELEEQDRQRWAQIVEEAREDLDGLREQIEQTADSRELDRLGKNPLVTAWRAKLFGLPPELREIEEKKLEIILGARKKDMEHRKELGAVGDAGELKFGHTTFSVYKEPPHIWQPKLAQRKEGFSEWADLVFEDSQGRIWKPDEGHDVVVEADLNSEHTKAAIERYRKEADEYFKGIKRRVPDFDEHWKITDYHMEKLEEIAEALNLQIANHRGILILQGEAGTGKNVMVDMLANLSNREVVTIACNENSTKEDLTYDFDFDPKTGTIRWPSDLVEGIQTPGVVVFFDEINALKPGIAKMTNPLFDYRRRLFQSQVERGVKLRKETIVDPTVLFVGAMNPQNYAGVNRLSPEVKSRSRVIDIDYPPFEEMRRGRTHYRSDEAEMLVSYMDKLGELKQREFKLCWDYVINRDTSNGADMILQGDPVLEADIRRVYDVIRVANRLRDMYAAYQIGDSNEPMDFPTSLRETTDIVMEMNHKQGVDKVVKRVIIPKIDDRRQKRIVDDSINATLGITP